MLVGYVISFFVIFNGVSMYLSFKDANDIVSKQRYKNTTVLELSEITFADVYVEALTMLPCRVVLQDVMLFSDTEYIVRNVEVIIRDPESEEIGECMIGDALAQYLIHKDGKNYYSLEGTLYEIDKVIDGKGGDLSYLIRIPYDMLNEDTKDVLSQGLSFTTTVLESNELDTSKCKKELEQLLATNGEPGASLNTIYLEDNQELKSESKLGFYLCIFAYVFCMVNCIIVCEFWLFQRRKEIAVRRACHFNHKMIGRQLLIDMMKIILLAYVIYLILHIVIFSKIMEYFSISIVFDIRSALFMVMMIPVSATITIIPYLQRLKKMSFVAGIREA